MKQEKEGLRILTAELSNFQNIEYKLINLEGKSVVFIGKNGSGKSATMRAIQSPIDSSFVPAKAIKNGEERGSIKLKIGGTIDGVDEEYTVDMYFDAEYQKGRIKMKDKDGNVIVSRGAQKSVLEYVSFDIDEFIRKGLTNTGQISKAGVMEQIEILKRFLSVEEKTTIHKLDKEAEEIYTERTDVNREIEKIKTKVAAYNFTQEELTEFGRDKSAELNELRGKQQDIAGSIVEYERAFSGFEDKKKRAAKLEKETSDLQKAIIAYKKLKPISDIDLQVDNMSVFSDIFGEINRQLGLLEFKIKMIDSKAIELKDLNAETLKLEKWLKANSKPSVESLTEDISKLSAHQEKYAKIKELESLKKFYVESNDRADWITKRLDAIKQEKKDVFTNSKLPVRGLAFDENGIYYNGLPFNESSHNSATIISVGLKVAMAMNPRLRCIFIKDGSLLDKDTRSKIFNFCNTNGEYQILMEYVDPNAEKDVEAVFLEEFIN